MQTALRKKIVISIGALALVLALGAFLSGALPNFGGQYAEAEMIAEGARDFDELSERFQDLSTEKGSVYAFEVLRRASLPPNTDLHLLGHVVGDELYKQENVGGIAHCTPEFRNACSHSIVIGALNEFGGAPALEKIRDACKKAPGGSGAYTMCYHGLGHGVFAFYDYDFAPTIELCKKTGSSEYFDREYIECAGGAVMELMGGGGHDKEKWEESRARYLSKENPLTPCSRADIPKEVKSICYTYITPHLFEAAGADLSNPGTEAIAGAFRYCDQISKNEPEFRDSCFSGIGKELPVLAIKRDIRALGSASDAELSQMRSWCEEAPHLDAYGACARSILDSLFWGGENDPRVSIRFCSLASAKEAPDCWGYLFQIADQYVPRAKEARSGFCALAPSEWHGECNARVTI